MKIAEFSLKHSLLFNLLTLVILVLGISTAFNMNKEAFPAVDFDIVTIRTIYPGADAETVELYVTNLLEDEVKTVDGIEEVKSLSSENTSLLVVKLDPDLANHDKSSTINNIQRAVDRVRDLPDEIKDPPLVAETKSSNMPVMEVTLSGLPYKQLHEIADDLSDRIEDLNDAKRPRLNGFHNKEFWVEVDPQNLKKHHVSLTQIVSVLGRENISLPGGVLETAEGDFLVRTVKELKTPEDIGELIIRTNDDGIHLKIKDIGQARRAYADSDLIYRVGGQSAIGLVIIKSTQGDIVKLVESVKTLITKYKKDNNLTSLSVSYINDLSVFVKNRLGVLLNNGIVGIILVLLCLLMFLSKGIAIVAAFGMPVAFLGAIFVMNLLGMTINLLSMFALVIVLGMLVDDAIIVAENIWQHYEQGKSPREAVILGTQEVFWPVTATILTTIAAFSPLLMVSGIFGKFISALPKVVIISLVISLIEAMFILPTHAYDALKIISWRKKNSPSVNFQESSSNKFLDRMIHGYGFVLAFCMKHRYIFTTALFSLLLSSFYFAKTHMKTVLFPTEGVEVFYIRASLPIGTSLTKTAEKYEILEQAVERLIPKEELISYTTQVGIQQADPTDPLTKRASHLGQLGVFLTPEITRDRTAEFIIESIREPIIKEALSKGFTQIIFGKKRMGPPVGKPVALKIIGKDLAEMSKVSKTIQEFLSKIPGVTDISDNYYKGKNEIKVMVNQDKASLAMLSVSEIALHVRSAIEGQIASYVQDAGERIPVKVRYTEESRSQKESIPNTLVINQRGLMVPLDTVADFQENPSVSGIRHLNSRRVITITTDLDEKTTTSLDVNQQLKPFLSKVMKASPHILIEAGGEYEDTAKSMKSLRDAFLLAISLILIILATQFRSLTQPLVIMTAIPFGFIGIILAFYLHGMPFSFLALIGMIGLTGVVVNDSIVLVDFINKARDRGTHLWDAVLQSGKRRFRAVWLTSITTIFGLIPLVYGIGGSDLFLRPAAMSLGFGLLFATVLILLFIPVLYLIRIDILNLMIRFFIPIAKQFNIPLNKIK